jgi:hypothetical protein
LGSESSADPRARRTTAGSTHLAQHRDHHPGVLLEQHGQQVLGSRLRVAALVGKPLGGLERLLRLDGETIELQSGPIDIRLGL